MSKSPTAETLPASDEFADTAPSEIDILEAEACDVADSSTRSVFTNHHYEPHQHSSPRLRVDEGTTRRVLTTAPLLAFSFFAICGGPAGSEGLVLAGGPFLGLLAMVVSPFVFYLPLAFMVTELSVALPVSGGHAYWVALAFGPTWGFQAGYWCWVSNCIDCAMYAAMTISSIVGPAKNTFGEFLFKSTFALLLAVPGLWSLRIVGSVLLLLMILVLLPYGFVSFWAAGEATRWQELLEVRRFNTTSTPDGDFVTAGAVDVDWGQLINAIVWAFSGFQSLSVLAAHVVNPEKTFWRVMWLSILLIPLVYIIPFMNLVAVGKPDWRRWGDGSMSDVVKTLGGEGVEGWIMAVDLVCSAGLYITALTISAFLANGMAKQGIAPTTVGLTTTGGTPHGAIFCSLAVILVIVNLEFEEMMLVTNALGGLEMVITIVAWIHLRFSLKKLVRPIKFCGNAHPIVPILLLLIPLALYVFVIGDAFRTFTSAVLTGAFLFVGLVYAQQADYDKFHTHVQETF